MADDADPTKAARNAEEFARLWFARIDARYDAKDWKAWREEAKQCEKCYSLEQGAKDKRFNIFFANVDTISAAAYNSLPSPDVRRRYGDADPAGKIAADVLERGISASCDLYDFDDVMDGVVHDGEVVGMGLARVRFDTKFAQPQAPGMGHNGGPAIDEAQDDGPQADGAEPQDAQPPAPIAWQSVWCEPIDWNDVVWSEATRWDAVEWIAFRHMMDHTAIATLNPKVAEQIKLTKTEDDRSGRKKGRNTSEASNEADKRGEVWEIWHKATREVLFIARDWPLEPLALKDDPLGLREFWPMPRPHTPIRKPHDLTPVPPYRLYADQAKELNTISLRITRLTAAAKAKGVYDSTFAKAFKDMESLEDGSFAPVNDTMAWKDKGLSAAIWMMPLADIMAALKQLHTDREAVKQVIYELIGVADIMRGTSAASETLGAQKLKTQWGSLRISRRQRAVQRYARDLFRLKGEILGKRFAPHVLSMMTGIDLQPAPMPPQAMQPQAMGVNQAQPQDPAAMAEAQKKAEEAAAAPQALELLRGDMEREYRVDIETDSTIQADVQQAQTNASLFLQGLGTYFTAVGPAVISGFMQPDEAADILASISRSFKLGRQGEDAIERMSKRLQKVAQGPQQQKPDPEAEKAQADHELKKQVAIDQAKREDKKLLLEEKKHNDTMLFQERQHNDKMALERDKAIAEDQRQRDQITKDHDVKTQQIGSNEILKREDLNQRAQQHESVRQPMNDIADQAHSRTAKEVSGLMKDLGPALQAIGEGLGKLGEGQQAQAQATAQLANAVMAETELVRGPDGKASGTRKKPMQPMVM